MQKIELEEKHRMKVVFVADSHLSHNNILTYCKRTEFMTQGEKKEFDAYEQQIRLMASWTEAQKRGFSPKKVRYSNETLNRMDDCIIENINAVAGANDVVWHLGDVLFAGKNPEHIYRKLRELRERINCKTINLVWGNHDKALQWWRNEKNCRPEAITEDQFYSIFNEGHIRAEITVQNQQLILDHYCMLVWEKHHRNTWMLYGHSHGSLESWKAVHLPHAKSFDVGVDNHDYKPWTFEQVKLEMAKKPEFIPIDHHEES